MWGATAVASFNFNIQGRFLLGAISAAERLDHSHSIVAGGLLDTS